MRNDRKIRDAKIQNGRYDRQERLDRISLEELTCRNCGTTENVGDTGLCSFCEDDEEETETEDAGCTCEEGNDEEALGACGSFGERLYDEGTELCDTCPISKTCFAMYKHWESEQA